MKFTELDGGPVETLSPSSYKVEVIADNSGVWAGNAMRYDSYREAETAAKDLASRWMLVREWRVTPVWEEVSD